MKQNNPQSPHSVKDSISYSGLSKNQENETKNSLIYTRPIQVNFLKRIITAAQVSVDTLTIILAFYLGHLSWEFLGPKLLSSQFTPASFSNYTFSIAVTILVTLTGFTVSGLYRPARSILNVKEFEQIIKTSLFSGVATLFILYLTKESFFSQGVFVATWGSMVLLFLVQRYFFFRFQNFLRVCGIFETRAVVYGAGNVATKLLEKLHQSPKLGYQVLGIFDDDPSRHGQYLLQVPIFGGYQRMEKFIKSAKVQILFLAIPNLSPKIISNVLDICKRNHCELQIVPTLYDIVIQRAKMEEVDGIPLVGMSQARYSWQSIVIKRMVDLLGSLIILVLLSPLFLVFYALVKLSSRGPALFTQERVGKNGRKFKFYKFRSMYVDAPVYAETPQSSYDPRITPIGRFLRRSSLDELPQLFNVLKGDMSLVGPRPEMPFIVDTYNDLHRQRLNVLPGITGLWQISADRKRAIHENMDYDMYYIHNQSVLLDFVILIKTVTSCIKGVGAY